MDVNDILSSFGIEIPEDPMDKTNENDRGIQTLVMNQIQQLYSIVDSYNTAVTTLDELGYKDISDTFKKYAQDELNKISYLQLITQTLAPTVERVTNPFNNNEITIIK